MSGMTRGEGEFTCKNIGSMNAPMLRTNVQLCTVRSGNQIATTSYHLTVKTLGSGVRLWSLNLLSSTTDRIGDLGRVSQVLHALVKRLIVTVVRVKTNSPRSPETMT